MRDRPAEEEGQFREESVSVPAVPPRRGCGSSTEARGQRGRGKWLSTVQLKKNVGGHQGNREKLPRNGVGAIQVVSMTRKEKSDAAWKKVTSKAALSVGGTSFYKKKNAKLRANPPGPASVRGSPALKARADKKPSGFWPRMPVGSPLRIIRLRGTVSGGARPI